MKKILLVAVGALAATFYACKEIGPSIDLTPKSTDTRAYDTTYTEAVPAAEVKRILAEEYTGVKCPNCPAGTTVLKNYAAAHPGRLVIVALHAGSLTDTVGGKWKHYFANEEVQNMVNNYLGGNTPPKPAAAFDRVVQNTGAMFIPNRNQWVSYLDQRLNVTTPVNLSLTASYDSATQMIVAKVKIVYTQPVTKKQNVSVWVLEDNIIDAQYDVSTTIMDYTHNYVFRDFITPVSGAQILDTFSTKEPGRVYERQFVHTPRFISNPNADRWNLKNCRVVAVVHNDEFGDKEVAQVVDTKLD